MSLNASGIRDTARVLKISMDTVIKLGFVHYLEHDPPWLLSAW